MKRNLASSLLLVCGASFAGLPGADLAWLVGCWASQDSVSREVWVADGPGRLVGFGVVVRDNRVAFHEVLTLERDDDDLWVYTAHPAGQATTSFTASELGEASAVFVNPGHDYPQRIRYARTGDELEATISLMNGENPASFTKTACTDD
jgi:hypothetical protein